MRRGGGFRLGGGLRLCGGVGVFAVVAGVIGGAGVLIFIGVTGEGSAGVGGISIPPYLRKMSRSLGSFLSTCVCVRVCIRELVLKILSNTRDNTTYDRRSAPSRCLEETSCASRFDSRTHPPHLHIP